MSSQPTNPNSLHYEVKGEGPVVVLGHAGFVDSRMWDAQWDTFTKHYRVIRYDMRGYGQSGVVTGPVARRKELLNLLQTLNVDRAHLVGSSLSGAVFLDLALDQPQMVRSLTTVSAVPNGFKMQGEPPRYMMEMFAAWQQGDFEQVTELQTRIWIDGIHREPDQVDSQLRQKAATMSAIPVQYQTMLIADSQPVDPLDPPATTRLHEIGCPVLVVDGGLDHPEVHRASELLTAEILNARRITISDTAHMPSMEKPTEFNRIVLDFLNTMG